MKLSKYREAEELLSLLAKRKDCFPIWRGLSIKRALIILFPASFDDNEESIVLTVKTNLMHLRACACDHILLLAVPHHKYESLLMHTQCCVTASWERGHLAIAAAVASAFLFY